MTQYPSGKNGILTMGTHKVSLPRRETKELCDKLCKPGLVAEEAVYRAKELIDKKKEESKLAWRPLGKFLVTRRLACPPVFLKARLKALVKERLTVLNGSVTKQASRCRHPRKQPANMTKT